MIRTPHVQMLAMLLLVLPLANSAYRADERPPWIIEGDVACPRIALVFNIGIGHSPSETILQTLIEKEVPATMFPMGSFARTQPEFLQRLDAAGFEIGTHGATSILLTGAPEDVIREDLRSSVDAIEVVIGRDIDPYHAPYAGSTDERVRTVVASEGLLPVGWGVSAPDWSDDATDEGVYNIVFHNTYPGAIVEMHLDGPATEQSTALALPHLVDDLRTRGFEFVTVTGMQSPCEASGTHDLMAISLTGLDVHGLHCKTAPSQGAGLIRILLNGDVVTTRGPVFDGWLPVQCFGRDGWVKASVLPQEGQAPAPDA